MVQRADITIFLFDGDGVRLLGSTKQPRKCVIKSGFGAGKQRCWLELYQENQHLPVETGNILQVAIQGKNCFRGRIQERRIDSTDDPLSCYAEFNPEREYNRQVFGTFENQTVQEILVQILYGSGLSLSGTFDADPRFRRLVFSGEPLWLAVDLLAKLAGNWIWDIRENNRLEFRPRSSLPEDRQVVLRRDADTVNLWQTTHDLYSTIEIMGGVKDGAVYEKTVLIPELETMTDAARIRVYIRPMIERDAYSAIRWAIIQQMTATHYEHYLDWVGNANNVEPGETIRVYAENVTLFPQNQPFRVKMREITYAHETLQTRFHVTSGWESAETYFHYFYVDYPIPRLGVFQLDVSALDSIAPLDAVPA